MTGDDLVRVFIYTDGMDHPYWDENPMSPSGDWYEYSMRHMHWIPRDQFRRWQAARAQMNAVENEIAGLAKAARR